MTYEIDKGTLKLYLSRIYETKFKMNEALGELGVLEVEIEELIEKEGEK